MNDCTCGHCHYDHVGFRDHLEGEARLLTSCRIAYCMCTAYDAGSEEEYNITYETNFDPQASVASAFDPGCTYGDAISYTGTFNSIPKFTKDLLHKKAKAILPPNQYYELRAIIPVNYGADKTICWIYEPWMSKSNASFWLPDLNPIQLNSNLGYYTIGGYHA